MSHTRPRIRRAEKAANAGSDFKHLCWLPIREDWWHLTDAQREQIKQETIAEYRRVNPHRPDADILVLRWLVDGR